MRKIFTLILSVLIFSSAFAQLERPTAVIKKTTVKPTLDGVIDEVWATADSLLIDRPFKTDNGLPTLGEKGQTWWKALWHEDGYYLLVNVTDDAYFPNYVKGSGNPWDYDKIEVYFDVNYVLEDETGGPDQGNGHYQVAPDMTLAKEDGALQTETNGRQHAFKVTKPNYVAEYFVPWSTLKDKEGVAVDKTGEIGFDVNINDSDPSLDKRRRGVWAHSGEDGSEAWNNMDLCGKITFEGAEAGTEVSSIKLTGGTITTDNGTLQIVAEVLPEDAEVKTLTWSVATKEGSTGLGTISSTGLLTATKDGVVTVTAKAQDASFIETSIDVTISGQVIQVSDVNLIKNGSFDKVGANGQPESWGGWIDGTYGTPATVVDGAVSCTLNQKHETEPWHYQFSQEGLTALPNIPYILKFKAWASKDRAINFDFESSGSADLYARYGSSSDANAVGGASEWDVNLTAEPIWFTQHVTFDKMVPTTGQKIQYMFSRDDGTIYLDSISLISEADMALIPTAISQERAMESFKVYPNPAVSKLYVDLSVAYSTVAIYNSVGVKMEEAIVNGTRHEFDVSRYPKGMYFVKANNAVVKFIK